MISTLRCAALAAFLATPALAEDFAVPIDLGKRAVIELTIVKGGTVVRGADKQTVEPMTFHYRQEITAIKDGYHVVQTLTGMDGTPSPDIKQAAQASSPLAYDTDESLAPTRVTNWPEVADKIAKTMASIDKTDPAVIEKATAPLRAMSPEMAAQSMLKEQNALAMVQMAGLDLHKPLKAKGQAPNPLGGPPIDQVISAELMSLDKRAGIAVVDYDATFDPVSLKASLTEAFQRMSGRAPTADDLANLKTENHLNCRYSMSLKTGLATDVICQIHNTVSAGTEGTASREETWRMTQRLLKP